MVGEAGTRPGRRFRSWRKHILQHHYRIREYFEYCEWIYYYHILFKYEWKC
jgi:hypothetical protein